MGGIYWLHRMPVNRSAFRSLGTIFIIFTLLEDGFSVERNEIIVYNVCRNALHDFILQRTIVAIRLLAVTEESCLGRIQIANPAITAEGDD